MEAYNLGGRELEISSKTMLGMNTQNRIADVLSAAKTAISGPDHLVRLSIGDHNLIFDIL